MKVFEVLLANVGVSGNCIRLVSELFRLVLESNTIEKRVQLRAVAIFEAFIPISLCMGVKIMMSLFSGWM